MTDITPLIPRQPVPALAVPLVGGGRFDIVNERPEHFTFVVFYRGLHCPICRTQLGELETKLPDFAKRGVGVVALSSDVAERAGRAQQEWKLPNLRLGYGLSCCRSRMGSLHLNKPRHDFGRSRGAGIIFRTRPVPGPAGPHALFCQCADDAVRAAAFHRHSCRPRLRHGKELSSSWRGDELTSGSGLTRHFKISRRGTSRRPRRNSRRTATISSGRLARRLTTPARPLRSLSESSLVELRQHGCIPTKTSA